MKIKLSFVIFLALAQSSEAYAHDLKYHKGKPIEGTITQLTSDGFGLKIDGESIKVKYVDGVTIEDEHEVSERKEDLHVGSRVAIFGTKLASGELVAKEIHLHSHDDGDETSPNHSHEK